MRSTPAPVVDVSAVHGTEDDLTRIQGDGGLLITSTLHLNRLRRTPAPVVDVSSMHAKKSTEDGQTTIQGVCWLVLTFTIHFRRIAAVAQVSSMFR